MPLDLKPDTGLAFPNDRRKEDWQADFQGEALIDGKKYWLNVWTGKTKEGKDYVKVSVREKTQSNRSPYKPRGEAKGYNKDDDVPY